MHSFSSYLLLHFTFETKSPSKPLGEEYLKTFVEAGKNRREMTVAPYPPVPPKWEKGTKP